jgi:cytochrome c oxidase subunit IV
VHETSPVHADRSPHPSGHGTVGHVVPLEVLVAVFVGLLALTAVTVAVTWVDLGPWNLIVALVIATFKAALVALYFMHLRYDHPFNGLVFVAGLVFLAIFLIFTLMDTMAYQPDVQRARDAAPPAAMETIASWPTSIC